MKEASKYLGVTKSTFRNLIAAGKIAHVAQYEDVFLFLENDVESLKTKYSRHGRRQPAPSSQTTPPNT